MAETKKIVVGKEVALLHILKDGKNYVAIRDADKTLGLETNK